MNSPVSEVVTTWSLFSEETIIFDFGVVLPDIVMVFLSKTSSSFGFSIVRKFSLFGEGVRVICGLMVMV